MTQATIINRPELTLPEEEAARVRLAYETATVILEYGSGGSTVLASELPGKRVFSVESDQAWAQMIRGYLDANPSAKGTSVEVIWADVGPTKKWGYPVDLSSYLQFPTYPLGVWTRPDFVEPDVVLIDGRFRLGCALATALHITKPMRVLFDDYAHRKRYHVIEKFFGEPTLHGRMAEFLVEPMPLRPDRLLAITQMVMRTD